MTQRRQALEAKKRVAGLYVKKSANIPRIARVERLRVFTIEVPGLLQCRGNGPRHLGGDKLRGQRNVMRRRTSARFRQNQILTFGQQSFLRTDTRQPSPHA